VLRGADLQGQAQTGSGKTAAYALPLLQQLLSASTAGSGRGRTLRALVLVPTRELATQVAETLRSFADALGEPLKILPLFGGVSINPQMMRLRGGADIVVATPGRLLDLVQHNALRLSQVSTLVLDEADRLLDAGFGDELSRVLALLPERRQQLLFSATFPPAVQALADDLLVDPVRIDVPASATEAPDITQRAIEVDAPLRTPLLRHLIQSEGWPRVLVFVATRYATELVAHKLQRAGIQAAAFHGEVSQGTRAHVLAEFKASRLQVLVATDVAARGIHISHLPVVVNHDLPRSAADHVHRIGRTGRAGEHGLAVSFISADTEAHFRLIEKTQGQRVPREQVAGFEPTALPESTAFAPAATGRDPNGGIKGARPSKKDKLRAAAAVAALAAAAKSPR